MGSEEIIKDRRRLVFRSLYKEKKEEENRRVRIERRGEGEKRKETDYQDIGKPIKK